MAKTLDDKQSFIKLRAKGYSFDKISKEIGVSKPVLIEWLKDEETSIAIDNIRSMELHDLQEQYKMTKKHRIESMSLIYQKAKDELSKRDLTNLSTDKLITLSIKLADALKAEEQSYTYSYKQEGFAIKDSSELKTQTL